MSSCSQHIIMIVQVTHRSWKNLKICFFLILALILLKFIFHYGRFKRHKTRKIPLLEQVGKNGSQRLHLKICLVFTPITSKFRMSTKSSTLGRCGYQCHFVTLPLSIEKPTGDLPSVQSSRPGFIEFNQVWSLVN